MAVTVKTAFEENMSLHSLALFCLAYLIATTSPGPAIAALLARVISRGTEGIVSFIAGFVIGDLVWFALAATGMAAAAQTAHGVFVLLKWAGAGYLLYLAFRLLAAPAQPITIQEGPSGERSSQLFFASLSLTLGNPKAMVFFLAVLPSIVNLRKLSSVDFVKLVTLISVTLSAVLAFYATLGKQARLLFQNSRAVRWLNIGIGLAMIGAAVAVATR